MKHDSASNYEAINSLTTDLWCKLWHHRLGHPGNNAFIQATLACDGMPKLQWYPFFKCAECIPEIFHKHKKGCRTNKTEPKTAELFQMDYGFVRVKKCRKNEIVDGNACEMQGTTMPLKPCRNGCKCYLLTTKVCTPHSWALPFADKKPHVSTVNAFLKK